MKTRLQLIRDLFWCSLLGIILFQGAEALADDAHMLNLYVWSNEVPKELIQQFERETGIKVNYASYDSNEELYAKMKAAGNPGYDIIEPSSYYVSLMRDDGLLQPINKKLLSNYGNLDPTFLNQQYDPGNKYAIPYFWTATGIFYNSRYFKTPPVNSWAELWSPQFRDQLLLMNDLRDVFAMAFSTLHMSINSTDPNTIKAAYEKLVSLLPNIKLFNDETPIVIAVDEDAIIGMMWSGDFMKAVSDNPDLRYIYPSDGYALSIDCFAIPTGAPHESNAYLFINFILRAKEAAEASVIEGYGTANAAARRLLPAKLRQQDAISPTPSELARAQFELALPPKTLDLYTNYWQLLKMQ